MDKDLRRGFGILLLIATACGGYYFTERQLDKARVEDVREALKPISAISPVDNLPTQLQMDEALRQADRAQAEAEEAMRNANRVLGQ